MPGAGDYHLRPDSPARDAGFMVPDVDEDLEGTSRPRGPASDIGAFEFETDPEPIVSLHVVVAGPGSVSSAPAGVACGSDCDADFPPGTRVALTATPASGFRLSGWTGGGCAEAGACTLVLNEDAQ